MQKFFWILVKNLEMLPALIMGNDVPMIDLSGTYFVLHADVFWGCVCPLYGCFLSWMKLLQESI